MRSIGLRSTTELEKRLAEIADALNVAGDEPNVSNRVNDQIRVALDLVGDLLTDFCSYLPNDPVTQKEQIVELLMSYPGGLSERDIYRRLHMSAQMARDALYRLFTEGTIERRYKPGKNVPFAYRLIRRGEG